MNALLAEGACRGLDRFGREALRAALRLALRAWREEAGPGAPPPLDARFWEGVEARLAVLPALGLCGAINATGVVLHTNLGRAPWPAEAMSAAALAARAAVLEIDRESGGRGARAPRLSALLRELSGAEDGFAVNNNAAAVLLAIHALARGRKVVVARGELVEIGGSYRMPEVIRAAGAEMVPIGTTNRVHLRDFQAALEDPAVALVLKVHPSNFEVRGFTHEVPIPELAALCRERGLPLVYDLGSGVLHPEALRAEALAGEPTVRGALTAGCEVVSFSGDKLLGGPQAGLLVGAGALIGRLRRDMLTRCLRLDKTILAALEAVLALHALGPEFAARRIPTLQRLALGVEELRARARAWAARLRERAPGLEVEVLDCASRVGSGASPTATLASVGLGLRRPGWRAEELARALRRGSPPVFARVQEGRVLLDLRTVAADEEVLLLQRLRSLAEARDEGEIRG